MAQPPSQHLSRSVESTASVVKQDLEARLIISGDYVERINDAALFYSIRNSRQHIRDSSVLFVDTRTSRVVVISVFSKDGKILGTVATVVMSRPSDDIADIVVGLLSASMTKFQHGKPWSPSLVIFSRLNGDLPSWRKAWGPRVPLRISQMGIVLLLLSASPDLIKEMRRKARFSCFGTFCALPFGREDAEVDDVGLRNILNHILGTDCEKTSIYGKYQALLRDVMTLRDAWSEDGLDPIQRICMNNQFATVGSVTKASLWFGNVHEDEISAYLYATACSLRDHKSFGRPPNAYLPMFQLWKAAVNMWLGQSELDVNDNRFKVLDASQEWDVRLTRGAKWLDEPPRAHNCECECGELGCVHITVTRLAAASAMGILVKPEQKLDWTFRESALQPDDFALLFIVYIASEAPCRGKCDDVDDKSLMSPLRFKGTKFGDDMKHLDEARSLIWNAIESPPHIPDILREQPSGRSGSAKSPKGDGVAADLDLEESSSKRPRHESESIDPPPAAQRFQSPHTDSATDLLRGMREWKQAHVEELKDAISLDIEIRVRASDSNKLPKRGEVGILLGALVLDREATARQSALPDSDMSVYRLGLQGVTTTVGGAETFENIHKLGFNRDFDRRAMRLEATEAQPDVHGPPRIVTRNGVTSGRINILPFASRALRQTTISRALYDTIAPRG